MISFSGRAGLNVPSRLPKHCRQGKNTKRTMRKTTVHILSITASVLLSMAGASLTVISCTKTTAPGTEASPEGAITFSGVDTKAAVEDASEIGKFSVWGYYTPEDASSTVFDEVTVTRDDSQWKYDGLKFWQSDKQYDFYALYPPVETLRAGGADDITCDASGALSITGFDSTSGHDLMTASNTGLSGTNPLQSVAFTFSHELSRLSFKLESNAVTVVSAALYGVDYRGTLTKSASSVSWSPSEGGTATQDSTPFEVENPPATEGTATLFDDILMIPHSDLTEAVLSISYRKNSPSGPDEIEKLSLNLSDTDVKAWEKGQSYRYTLQLNMGKISVNVSVLPWVQENTSVEW